MQSYRCFGIAAGELAPDGEATGALGPRSSSPDESSSPGNSDDSSGDSDDSRGGAGVSDPEGDTPTSSGGLEERLLRGEYSSSEEEYVSFGDEDMEVPLPLMKGKFHMSMEESMLHNHFPYDAAHLRTLIAGFVSYVGEGIG